VEEAHASAARHCTHTAALGDGQDLAATQPPANREAVIKT